MYCPHCGKFIEEKNKNKQFKWNVLGFFLPFIGFILGMAWEDEKPNTAKAAGIGALAGEITKALLFILLIVIQVTSVRMSMMP